MKLLQKLSFVLLLFFALSASAQTEKEDPIDEAYHKCLGTDTAYANICNCAFTAYGKWDGEMNSAYKKLMKTLKKEKDKAALKQSQTAWMAYRDAEFKSYDNMFNLPGGNWCSHRQDGRIDMVRARTLQLRGYIEAFKILGKR